MPHAVRVEPLNQSDAESVRIGVDSSRVRSNGALVIMLLTTSAKTIQ